MDVTVENITSVSPASKTAGEVSVVCEATDHSPNGFPAFCSSVDASDIDGAARTDALDSVVSKISVDNSSMVPDADDLALNASHVSASTSLTVFAESMPTCVEGRLIPPPILHWLRSRLATEGEYSVSTLLTLAWWQPILMRILPLDFMSSIVNYRLQSKLSTSYSKSASWWRGISIKNPSADQINRVCGNHRLVYLRTTDILDVIELKSCLRKHWLYRRTCILAMFPFATNLWEILIAPNYVDPFIECAEACGFVAEQLICPGDPVGHPSDFRNPFESSLRARERLIGRASIAWLASRDNDFASRAATIYRDLVKLYRCYDAYKTVVSTLLHINQPAYSPGWSCIVGLSQYPTNDTRINEHCE